MIADQAAEGDLLGAVIRTPRLMERAYGRAEPGWFRVPTHAELWRLLASLWSEGEGLGLHGRTEAWDHWTVRNAWTSADPNVCDRDGDRFDALVQKIADVAPTSIGGVLDRLEVCAYRDRMQRIAAELADAANDDGATLDDLTANVQELTSRLETTPRVEAGVWLGDFIAQPDTDDPWVIPGMLRRGWRAIIVAPEGRGKTTLLRQMAVCASLGVHPLTVTAAPPQRVLIVDTENPAELNRRAYRSLWRSAHPDASTDSPVIRYAGIPEGLDLRKPRDRAVVEHECRLVRPDLLVMGPLYKLYQRDGRESDEQAAMAVQRVLDQLRVRYGCALLLEHHAPHGEGGRNREMRPFGSSAWLRWPEIGAGLDPDPERKTSLLVKRWRGDRITAQWPDRLDRGTHLPWTGYWHHGIPTEDR